MRLSYIIPCYKVEKYIRKCLDSIYSTTMPHTDFEVLCFNDSSPDSTPSIIEEYVAKYANISVIHSKVNYGPGGGRNKLLEIAQGDYVWFVDADDEVYSVAVPEIIREAEDNQLDVLVIDYIECSAEGCVLTKGHKLPDTLVAQGKILANQIFKGGVVNYLGYPWRFVLRKDYLLNHHIYFPEHMTYGEDTMWTAKMILLSERMQAVAKSGYVYWHHEESVCGILYRMYPGKTIFEKCIMTPMQLIEFVSELKELSCNASDFKFSQYADELEVYAREHYINSLPIMLCRTTYKERKNFYKYLDTSPYNKLIRKYANITTKLCMSPVAGYCFCSMISLFYKLTH